MVVHQHVGRPPRPRGDQRVARLALPYDQAFARNVGQLKRVVKAVSDYVGQDIGFMISWLLPGRHNVQLMRSFSGAYASDFWRHDPVRDPRLVAMVKHGMLS